MNVIFGNYGDNTIALIQWAHQASLVSVWVINIDTKWGAINWQERVTQGQSLAQRYGFQTITLTPSHGFEDLVADRNSFPNAKYQWCPTFLKALPLLTWLDENDPTAEATILLGSRRLDSRARANLVEVIEESQHYGGRRVWCPLYKTSSQERDQLINATGLTILNHRSLECAPCIHSSIMELQHLDAGKVAVITQLEQHINETMFHSRYPTIPIEMLTSEADATNSLELSDLGCGSHFVCGE